MSTPPYRLFAKLIPPILSEIKVSDLSVKGGLKHWFRSSSGMTLNSVINGPAFFTGEISVHSGEIKQMAKALAFDINNLSIASVETIQSINEIKSVNSSTSLKQYKNIPWIFVKNYYSAFYAAQALVRYLASPGVVFEAGEISNIKNRYLSSISGEVHDLSILKPGFHEVKLDFSSRNILIKGSTKEQKLGNHERVWSFFCKFIDEILRPHLIFSGLPSALELEGKLTILRQNLMPTTGNGYNVFSYRNDIHYIRPGFEKYWFPYEGITTKDLDDLFLLSENWKKSPMDINLKGIAGGDQKENVKQVVVSLQFVVSLLKDLMVGTESLQGTKRSFTSHRIKKFCDSL